MNLVFPQPSQSSVREKGRKQSPNVAVKRNAQCIIHISWKSNLAARNLHCVRKLFSSGGAMPHPRAGMRPRAGVASTWQISSDARNMLSNS